MHEGASPASATTPPQVPASGAATHLPSNIYTYIHNMTHHIHPYTRQWQPQSHRRRTIGRPATTTTTCTTTAGRPSTRSPNPCLGPQPSAPHSIRRPVPSRFPSRTGVCMYVFTECGCYVLACYAKS